MRKQLEQQLDAAKKQHSKNQSDYHNALEARSEADEAVRKACDAASDSANAVAGLEAALSKFPKKDAA